MDLVEIGPPAYDVALDLAYATGNNVLGRPIYRHARAYLRRDAAACLAKAIGLAADIGYRLKIFDAHRPTEAQWMLWNSFPQPGFVADPRKGSPHSRGVAIDLTLIDERGAAIEMGIGFDDPTVRDSHVCPDVSPVAQHNRAVRLGIMTAAGWDFYDKEWWHYQLFNVQRYPLYSDSALGRGLM